jgi:hypothetical protein
MQKPMQLLVIEIKIIFFLAEKNVGFETLIFALE